MSTSENVLISCGFPSSNNSKSFLGQVIHEVAARIGDNGIDVDEVHLDLERHLREGFDGQDDDKNRSEEESIKHVAALQKNLSLPTL